MITELIVFTAFVSVGLFAAAGLAWLSDRFGDDR